MKIAWDHLNSKCKPTTAPKYIKIEKMFPNGKLVNNEQNPDTWITNLENLNTDMNRVIIT